MLTAVAAAAAAAAADHDDHYDNDNDNDEMWVLSPLSSVFLLESRIKSYSRRQPSSHSCVY